MVFGVCSQIHFSGSQNSEMKKKLLIVVTVPVTMNLILKNQPKYLNDYFEVHIATSSESGFDLIQEREKVPVHRIEMVRGINPLADLKSIWQAICLIKHLNPDIVHSYTPKAGLVAMLSAKLIGVPVRMHTFTGLIFPSKKGLKRLILKMMDRLICFCATHIIPESRGVKRILIDEHITTKPLELIGSGNVAGVDLEFYDPQLFPKGKDTETKNRFVFVGRLHRDKGIKELVEAFEMIGSVAELTLVGDMDEEGMLDDITLSKIRSNRRISWVGFQEDIRPFLADADILVLPSYREGFPNVVLQAGAMGLPCLVTDIPGSNEIIEQDENGWIVPPRDSITLHAAMEKCLTLSNWELDTMGRYAREKISALFEQRTHWDRVNQFYQGLLKK